MTTQIVQISNAANLYTNSLNSSVASNTTLTINSGQTRDSTNAYDITLSATTTLNTATVGANGLDVGTLAASSWYYLYVIGDSTNYKAAATLLSLSSSAPTMPRGYDVLKMIGVALTDGTVHFLPFYMAGNGGHKIYQWKSMIRVLNGGTSNTFVAVDCSAALPILNNLNARFYASYTPNTAGNIAQFRPTGSSATTVFDISGVVASKAQDLQFSMITQLASSLPEIDYQLSSGSDALTLYVLGFDLFL